MFKKKFVIIALIGILILAAGIFTVVFLSHNNNYAAPAFLDPETKIKTNLPETTLVYVFNGKQPGERDEVLSEVAKKAKAELNVNLVFESFEAGADTYMNDLKAATSAGQSFDGFYYSAEYPDTLKEMADAGSLKDITDIFPKYAPACYNALTVDELKAVSIEGKVYVVPRLYHSAQIISALVRDDLMQKYKIPGIKSYDDYDKYLKAVKENEKDVIPMVINGNATGISIVRKDTTIDLFAQANGYVVLDGRDGLVYKWDDPDMKILAWEQTQGYKDGIKRISSWLNKGYLSKEVPVLAMDNTAAASDKFASILSYYGDEASYNVALKGSGISWNYKAYPLSPDQPAAMGSAVCGIAIPQNSQNAERSLMFINWLESNQENYDSVMYGIKGTTYNLKGDQIVSPTNCLSWPWRAAFLNEKFERSNPAMSKEVLANYIDTVKRTSKYPPHVGFVPDYTAVKDIINRREVAYIGIGERIYVKNNFAEDDVNEYIQNEKDSGIDTLVAEIQKQLDGWMSGK